MHKYMFYVILNFEKVFAINGQAVDTQPLEGGSADDEIRFFRVDFVFALCVIALKA